MKKTLLLLTLFSVTILSAQNTIATADPVDGTEDLVGTTNPPTYSGLDLGCNTTEGDIFYSHDLSTGDNKITIGLTTLPNSNYPTSGIIVNYQIIRAIDGDINDLEEVLCSTYSITRAGGGSFTYMSSTALLDTDDYYLRVYAPGGLSGPDLGQLVAQTDITMTSEFDATLSSPEISVNGFSYKVTSNSIELTNAQNFKTIYVFDIAGKQIMNVTNEQSERSIDISRFKNGVYIMNLIGNQADNKSVKFIKN